VAKTIHILGAGQWQLPTIRLAKQLGFRVLVSDVYQNRPGYAIADEHAVVDITDLEGTLAIAREHDISGIVCDTTDVGVPTMAYVAGKLGLPGIGYETALNFTDKSRMREITSRAGVPNPPFHRVRVLPQALAAAQDLGFPLVVKPVDSQSSRGVHIVRDASCLAPAYEDARRFARSGAVIVEGFLDGTEVTVESFCVDGRVFAAGISDKGHFAHRPEVADRLTYPAALPSKVMDRIRKVNRTVIQCLGMRTGVAHAEYMVVGEEVFLVEIAARGAGSMVYTHIVPFLAGAAVPQAYLDYVMGGTMSVQPAPGDRAANLACFVFPTGIVKRIRGLEEARSLPGVQEILLEFGHGDVLAPPTDDRSRPGLAVVFGETRDQVLATTRMVFETVHVETE
jgi:carbamoyl-phosphate synthase large subunit